MMWTLTLVLLLVNVLNTVQGQTNGWTTALCRSGLPTKGVNMQVPMIPTVMRPMYAIAAEWDKNAPGCNNNMHGCLKIRIMVTDPTDFTRSYGAVFLQITYAAKNPAATVNGHFVSKPPHTKYVTCPTITNHHNNAVTHVGNYAKNSEATYVWDPAPYIWDPMYNQGLSSHQLREFVIRATVSENINELNYFLLAAPVPPAPHSPGPIRPPTGPMPNPYPYPWVRPPYGNPNRPPYGNPNVIPGVVQPYPGATSYYSWPYWRSGVVGNKGGIGFIMAVSTIACILISLS